MTEQHRERRSKKADEPLNLDEADFGGGKSDRSEKPASSSGGGRQKRGWDSTKSGDDDEKLRMTAIDSDDDDTPVIPELEASATEVQLPPEAEVTMAPNVKINQIKTFKELDDELLNHSAFVFSGQTSLALLCESLTPEVTEEDEVWDWNALYTSVSSQLMQKFDNLSLENNSFS